MPEKLLEVCDVHRAYGDLVALDGVSFEVFEGEIFGLLGPNGAGKTTLMSILSCLAEPSRGEVRLQGRRVVASDREVRRSIGIVPQELALYDQLTARENLEFFGELFGIQGSELRRRVDNLLMAVGLESRGRHRVGTFSGGMKRRLNLAAALVHQPRLLLLDEPTVGVDPQSRNLIFEEVRRLQREGVTVVYTTHYMEEVEALCNRIGIIDRGKLLACDTLPALLQQLQGAIRLRLTAVSPELRRRLLEVFQGDDLRINAEEVSLACSNVQGALVRLVGLLSETQSELLHLETQEPNLERVFLHLTGRALRD
ncbi:MAG: ABC transporter ATP-binding protein [Gemmataceae bacterium]